MKDLNAVFRYLVLVFSLLVSTHSSLFAGGGGGGGGCTAGEASCPIEMTLGGSKQDDRSPDEFYKFLVPASQNISVKVTDHNDKNCGSWWFPEYCELTLTLHPLNDDGTCSTSSTLVQNANKTQDFQLDYTAEGGKFYCVEASGNRHDQYDIQVTGTAELKAGISDASKQEDQSPMTFRVALTKARPSATVIHYTFHDGSAINGTNYTGNNGSVTIPANQLSATFDVPLINRHMTTSKTFTVTISSNDVAIDQDSSVATGTIIGSDSEDADNNYQGPDICYDSRQTNGFCMFGSCMFYKETTHVRAMVDGLSNIHVQKALTRGIAFMNIFSGIGIDGQSMTGQTDSDRAENRQFAGFDFVPNSYYLASMFPKGYDYRIGKDPVVNPTSGCTNPKYPILSDTPVDTSQSDCEVEGGHMNKGDTTSYYDQSLIKLGLFTQYTHLVTYTKNGKTYQEVLQACNPDTYGSLDKRPEFSQCGVFLGALNSSTEVKFTGSGQSVEQDKLNTPKISGNSATCSDGGVCSEDNIGSHTLALPTFMTSEKTNTIDVPYSMVIPDQHVGHINVTHDSHSEGGSETRYIVFEAPYSKSYGGRVMLIKSIHDSDTATGTYHYVFKRGDYWIEDLNINKSNNVVFEVAEGVRFFIKDSATIKGGSLKIGYKPQDTSAKSGPHFYMYLYDDLNIQSPNVLKIKSGYIYAKDTVKLRSSGILTTYYTAITADTLVDAGGDSGSDYSFADAKDSHSPGLFEACPYSGPYLVGPFDAWDTFRHNTSVPPQERFVSTKIVAKPFALALASLNKENNAYETKNSAGGSVEVAIYKHSSIPIKISTNTFTFDANATKQIPSTEDYNNFKFVVPKAEKNAYVGFRFCATYELNDTTGNTLYTLYPGSNCSGADNECNATTSNNQPTWHICSGTDDFAIRPNDFLVTVDNLANTAGHDMNITFKALDANNNPANQFNQTAGGTFDVIHKETKSNCATGAFNPDINSSWSFTNGKHSVITNYSEVGDINITITDKDKSCLERFASTDCNDTNVTGHWNTDTDTAIGTSSVSNITFTLDHFSVSAITLKDNHQSSNANFTYLASQGATHTSIDPNMNALLDLTIVANNEKNGTTINYNNQCYAKPIDLNISYLINGTTASSSNPGNLSNILYSWYDDNTSANSSAGYEPLGGTLAIHSGGGNSLPTSIFNTDHNGTAKLTVQLNFDRRFNAPVNPFELHISDIDISDGLASDNSDDISADHNATFLYARAKPSKYFYDDIENNNTSTPVSILIYQGSASTIDMQYPMSKEFPWYLSKYHDNSSHNDGNLHLISQDSSKGTIAPQSPTIANGMTSNVIVSAVSSIRPLIVDVNLTGSDSWLIYNKEADKEPVPFYRVRFVGSGDWSGTGKTGHVVGSTISKKKSHRVEW